MNPVLLVGLFVMGLVVAALVAGVVGWLWLMQDDEEE